MIDDTLLAVSVLTRLRLVLVLEQSQGAPFSQLGHQIGVSRRRLTFHLGLLQTRGIVQGQRQGKGNSGNPSFYSLTERGQRLAQLLQELA
jgi:predicted ArsR family transcriptional regulator